MAYDQLAHIKLSLESSASRSVSLKVLKCPEWIRVSLHCMETTEHYAVTALSQTLGFVQLIPDEVYKFADRMDHAMVPDQIPGLILSRECSEARSIGLTLKANPGHVRIRCSSIDTDPAMLFATKELWQVQLTDAEAQTLRDALAKARNV